MPHGTLGSFFVVVFFFFFVTGFPASRCIIFSNRGKVEVACPLPVTVLGLHPVAWRSLEVEI
jgi:hypothetical protein